MAESGPFDTADGSLLEAALNQSFSSVPRPSPNTSVESGPALPAAAADAADSAPPAPIVPNDAIESWKSEYDSQVQAWRAESAEAREKAEKERERWEAVREKEAKENPRPDMSGWETVGSKNTSAASSVAAVHTPCAADARDLVTGEQQRAGPSHSSGDEAAKWEDVPSSVSSSFPSMTFPEHEEEEATSAPPKRGPPPEAPMSATLAIFDSSLSSSTRVKALFASLAINLLLPFVNGVMLGFGEIFAKNVVLAWWKPGSTVTRTGIRGLRKS